MRYILVTELVNTGISSCKIMGLSPSELAELKQTVTELHLLHTTQEHFIEVDTQGVMMLNLMAKKFNYRVAGQSMVIEKSEVGGRTVQVQALCWTLGRDHSDEQ